MDQRSERAPNSSKFRWLLTRVQPRIISRSGLRYRGSSGFLTLRPIVAFPEQVRTRTWPALPNTGKINARTAARLAWSIWGLSMTLTAASLILLVLNLSQSNVRIFDHWDTNTVMAVGCSAVGVVIASRRPENTIGWIFCAIGLASAVRHFGAQYAIYALLAAPSSLPGGEAAAWIASWLWVLFLGLLVFLGLLFPTGRLPTSRWRWVAWLCATVVLTGAISVAFSPGPVYGLGSIQNPLGIDLLAVANMNSIIRLVLVLEYSLGLAMAISLFVRLHRARGTERQQLKWFAYAVTIALSGAIPEYVIFPMVGVSVSWVAWANFTLILLGLVGIPIAMGIAILKYRLYDIDTIVNRTLVYGTLSASVVGIYMLGVGGLGALLQAGSNFTISLLATGLVAVLFQPLRSRLQRGVNHLMYGERDEPYRVLSRLGQRLEDTLAPNAVLPAIVVTIRDALKLPYAAIELKRGDESEIAASAGISIPNPLRLPLVYQGEEVGQLLLGPRGGETFAPADRRLLTDLARQAGVAAHAVRLTAELQCSNENLKLARERLVTAREEERRRLRRDLHDGPGPALASESLKVGAIRKLLARDQAAADSLLLELANDIEATIADIRRLVYDLRPPALDDLGLVTAMREHAAQYQGHVMADAGGGDGGFQVEVEAPESLPPLPAAVEVAAYRTMQEALTNVARHARARRCIVRLSLEQGAVRLEVTDDGLGLPVERKSGVGLLSMRERAEELGGTFTAEVLPTSGTRILARFPRDEEG